MYFENEGIWTTSISNDFLLAILSVSANGHSVDTKLLLFALYVVYLVSLPPLKNAIYVNLAFFVTFHFIECQFIH